LPIFFCATEKIKRFEDSKEVLVRRWIQELTAMNVFQRSWNGFKKITSPLALQKFYGTRKGRWERK
jgi:hypothetical protein